MNNLKQIGLAVHNYEGAHKRLPHPGQCDSTGGASTVYMSHSTPTLLLPYMDQAHVYANIDSTFTFAQMSAAGSGYTVAQLNPKSVGRAYNDPNATAAHRNAFKTHIKSFICPSTPMTPNQRSPDGWGLWDYMFISVCDVDDGTPGTPPPEPVGTRPTNATRRQNMTIQGMLTCDPLRLMVGVTDGTSNTILCIEDAGRAHPSAGNWGSLSSRPSPVNEGVQWTGGATNGRRMYTWADPDSGTNGFSGPSNAIAPASRVIAINQNATPPGGPPSCLWSQNNCGPNDEPFSFHPGGVNCLMGDGSVRWFPSTIPAMTLKWLTGATDGQTVTLPD